MKKSIDGVLGTQTRGGRMVGTDKSTELWRHPKILKIVYHRKKTIYIIFTGTKE